MNVILKYWVSAKNADLHCDFHMSRGCDSQLLAMLILKWIRYEIVLLKCSKHHYQSFAVLAVKKFTLKSMFCEPKIGLIFTSCRNVNSWYSANSDSHVNQ